VTRDRWTAAARRPQLSSMIGSTKPLAAPLHPPCPSGRRLAPPSCAPDSSPALTPAVERPGQSQSDGAPPPPRPDVVASSLALRASPQLNRWSRSRALRSNRRPGLESALSSSSAASVTKTSRPEDAAVAVEDGEDDDVCVDTDAEGGKAIYIVSDGTGWTAEHSVNAALGQFEHCFVDRGCAVNTHLFSMVNISPCLHILFFCWRYVHGALAADRVSSYHGRCSVLSSNYGVRQLEPMQFLDCSCNF
jgi:[pyruvate, phosphate dikinase]-phosphate phosphotransferase / [pyruvate, phosphate dikinase] kinase